MEQKHCERFSESKILLYISEKKFLIILSAKYKDCNSKKYHLFAAIDIIKKLRLTQGLDIKEVEDFEGGEEKDEIRSKILSIMEQVFDNIMVV